MSEADGLKQRTARLSVISNSFLVIMKLFVGFNVGAMSLVSEGIHSAVDLLASFIALWSVKKSVAPPDTEHDYGHGKYENVSAAFEASLIVLAAVGILYESADEINANVVPEYLEYGIAVMVLSIAVNYLVSCRLISVAKETGSQALEADGLHLRADIWTSVGVLVGLALIKLTGWAWLDPIIAIVVAAFILRSGWKMVIEAINELTDTSLPPEIEQQVEDILNSCKYTVGCHCLRTRKSGSYRMLDVHLLFPGDMTLEKVHVICDCLENRIRHELGAFDVLIHAEPFEGHLPESKQLQYHLSRQS